MQDKLKMPSIGEKSHQPLSFQSPKHMFSKKNVITQLLYSKRVSIDGMHDAGAYVLKLDWQPYWVAKSVSKVRARYYFSPKIC